MGCGQSIPVEESTICRYDSDWSEGLENPVVTTTVEAEPEPCQTDDFTDLMKACFYDQTALALSLLDGGCDNVGFVSGGGHTALIWACMKRQSTVAIKIVQTGESNPGHIDPTGCTALIWACMFGLNDVATELIKTGKSNPGHVGPDGQTALMWTLMNKGTQASPLNPCILNKSFDVSLRLIATDQANPAHRDPNNMDALAWACIHDQDQIVEALVACGVRYELRRGDIRSYYIKKFMCVRPAYSDYLHGGSMSV